MSDGTISGEEEMPTGKDELMEWIGSERAAFEESFSDLEAAEMAAPGPEGWSVKDHVAHIATWERILLISYLGGQPFGEAAGMDEATSKATEHMTAETGLNDYFFARDRDLTLNAVLADFHETHRQVLEALEATEWETLMEPELFGHVAANTYEHYVEHREIVEAIRAAAG